MQNGTSNTYANEAIARAIKQARTAKGLTQRDLAARSGVPQAHISKIESNAVDLRLSSLVALAHALGLEIHLLPHKLVPALQSLTRSAGMNDVPPRPAYILDDDDV